MRDRVKTIFDLIQSMGGLATGTVLSLLFAVLLLASEVIPLDKTVLALAWLVIAFIFAIAFYTARMQMKEEQAAFMTEG